MGCWNKTCMISNMPIRAGEDVISIFLARRPDAKVDDHCYHTTFYDPLPFLIYGKYNDYGAVEDFNGPQDDIIQEFFRRNIVEMEEGENKYHDIPVTKDKLDMEMLYEYDHENRLFINHSSFGKRTVDHVQIKRSLFDRILADTIIDSYTGDGYEYVTFNSLMYNIDGAVKWLKAYWSDEEDEDEDMKPASRAAIRRMRMLMRDIDQLVHGTWRNTDIPPLCAWLRKKEYHGVEDLFVEEFQKADFERAKVMLIERIKFSWLETWIARNRHSWVVPTGEGSQSQEMDGHILLGQFMLEEANKFKYEEEWEERAWEQPDLFEAA